MRLHRLTLTNLNSLRGTHVVDFDRALDDAPIFLIHGPTGAGKSTLMDAISLALFAATPRLGAATYTGREAIGLADGRQAMTRGTGTAEASLVFSRLDGTRRRYFCATWGARRAHNRPDGNFQAIARGIDELSSPDPEDRKTGSGALSWHGSRMQDAREAFAEALGGMEIDDFQRSMLLAQGEFARFLTASASERASILERITATERFTAIGARAAARCRDERSRVARLEAEMEGVALLPEEERAALEAEQQTLGEEAAGAEAALAPLQRAAQWLERLAEQAAEERARAADVRSAGARWAALGPERERVALHARTQPAREALARRDRARAERDRLQGALEQAQAQAQVAEARHAAAVEAATARRQALREAEEALRTERPVVEAAREAWAARAQARTLHARLASERAVAADKARKAREALGAAQRQAALAEEALAEATDRWEALSVWHALVADDAPVADADRALGGFRDAVREAQRLERERVEAAAAVETARSEREALEASLAPGVRACVEAAEALVRAQDGLAAMLGPDETVQQVRARLAAQRGDVEARVRAVDEAEAQCGARARAASECADHAARVQEVRGKQQEAQARAVEAAQGLHDLEDPLASAREHLRTAELGMRFLADREALVPGEPCPLCGSVSHGEPADREDALELRERAAAARSAVDRLLSAQEAHRLAREEARAEEARCSEGVRAAEEALEGARARLAERERTLAAAWAQAGGEGPADAAAVAGLRGVLGAELEGVVGSERGLESAWGEVQQAEEALRVAEKAREASEAELVRLRALEQERAARAERLEVGMQAAWPAVDRAWAGLVERAAPWPLWGGVEWAGLEASERLREAEEWITSVRRGVRQARSVQEKRSEASSALEKHRERVVLLQGSHEEASEGLGSLEGQVTSAAEAVAAVERRVEGFHGGRDPAQVLEELEGRVSAARGAAEQADRAVGELLEERTSLQERVRTSGAALGEAEGQLAESERLSAGLLLDVGLEEGAARDAALEASEFEAAMAAIAAARARQGESLAVWRAALARLGETVASGGAETLETLETLALAAAQEDALEAVRRALSQVEEVQQGVAAAGEAHGTGPGAAVDEAGASGCAALSAVLEERLGEGRAQVRLLQERRASVRGRLEADAESRSVRAQRAAELVREREGLAVWEELNRLIGVREGQAFQQFAQALNLEQILVRANVHLSRLAPRYRLVQRLEDGAPQLDFAVRDAEHADQERPLTTLSGGETFLCSLALALGLAGLRRGRLNLETLLLDEGFGTLDEASLSMAVGVLEQLQVRGYRVGLISHVGMLRERIAARIEVRPLGGGYSRLVVHRGAGGGEPT